MLAPISNFEPAKHSKNGHGTIRGYAASTNQGPVREYNEDRVAIILNFSRPENCSDWKKPAYFGVFDGHGGMDCADFLRDNLHNFIAKDKQYNCCNLVFLRGWKKRFESGSKCVKKPFWISRIWERSTSQVHAELSLSFTAKSATSPMWGTAAPS